MKTITKYQCDVCHFTYDTMEEAMECERHHTRPIEVYLPRNYKVPMDEIHGYPRIVGVKMLTGKIIPYEIDKDWFHRDETGIRGDESQWKKSF